MQLLEDNLVPCMSVQLHLDCTLNCTGEEFVDNLIGALSGNEATISNILVVVHNHAQINCRGRGLVRYPV